jgi:hypothetical protein
VSASFGSGSLGRCRCGQLRVKAEGASEGDGSLAQATDGGVSSLAQAIKMRRVVVEQLAALAFGEIGGDLVEGGRDRVVVAG